MTADGKGRGRGRGCQILLCYKGNMMLLFVLNELSHSVYIDMFPF